MQSLNSPSLRYETASRLRNWATANFCGALLGVASLLLVNLVDQPLAPDQKVFAVVGNGERVGQSALTVAWYTAAPETGIVSSADTMPAVAGNLTDSRTVLEQKYVTLRQFTEERYTLASRVESFDIYKIVDVSDT